MPSNSQMVTKNGDASHGIRDKIINKANPNKQTGSSSGIIFTQSNMQVYPGKQASGKKNTNNKKHMECLEPSKNQSFIYIYIWYIKSTPAKENNWYTSSSFSLSLLLQNPEKKLFGLPGWTTRSSYISWNLRCLRPRFEDFFWVAVTLAVPLSKPRKMPGFVGRCFFWDRGTYKTCVCLFRVVSMFR